MSDQPTPLARYSPEELRLLWESRGKIRVTDSGCWEWTGATNFGGYGHIHIRGRGDFTAHRFAWSLINGSIPEGLYVLHRCDNRLCCRPDHLFLGTQRDNILDCVDKGRLPFAALTREQVLEIKAKLAARKGRKPTYAQIAAEYGVGRQAVKFIATGRTWRHVQ